MKRFRSDSRAAFAAMRVILVGVAFAAMRVIPACGALAALRALATPSRTLAVLFAASMMLAACEKDGDGPFRRDGWQLPVLETARTTLADGALSGYVRSWEYDGRGRPVRSVMRGLDGGLIRDSVIAYVDRTAHSTQTSDAFVTARRTTYADDALTRPVRDEYIKRERDTGEVWSGSLEERTYDGAGRLIGCKYFERVFNDYTLSGERTDYLYEGRTVRYVERSDYGEKRVETTFADDALCRALRRTTSYFSADGRPGRTFTESWEYDAQGRKIGLHTQIDGITNVEQTDFVYSPQRLTYRKTVYLSDGSVYLVTEYEIVYTD